MHCMMLMCDPMLPALHCMSVSELLRCHHCSGLTCSNSSSHLPPIRHILPVACLLQQFDKLLEYHQKIKSLMTTIEMEEVCDACSCVNVSQ